jgi:SpoU rRNA methylase family enzyme
MATIEKLLQVKLGHQQLIFDQLTDTLNASRPDLTLTLDRERRRILVRHTAPQHAGKTVEIPYEAVLNICYKTEQTKDGGKL